jgi:hypothetical protein
MLKLGLESITSTIDGDDLCMMKQAVEDSVGGRDIRYALDHAIYLRDRLIRSGKFPIVNQTQRIPVVALTIDKS